MNHTQFEVAEFLYCYIQMSASNVDILMESWEVSSDDYVLFKNCEEMHQYIDAVPYGKV